MVRTDVEKAGTILWDRARQPHWRFLEESNGELTDGRIMKREVAAILRRNAMLAHRWSLEEDSSAPYWKSLAEGYGALTEMDEWWRRQLPRAPFQSAFTGESDSVLVGLPILFPNQLDGPVNARPGVPQRLPLLSRLMGWGPARRRRWCSLSVTWAIPPWWTWSRPAWSPGSWEPIIVGATFPWWRLVKWSLVVWVWISSVFKGADSSSFIIKHSISDPCHLPYWS